MAIMLDDVKSLSDIIQEDAIASVLEGKHTVLHLATGSGKTLPQITSCLFTDGEYLD